MTFLYGFDRYYFGIRELGRYTMEWEAFLKPFASDLWAAIGCVAIACSISLAVTYRQAVHHGSENLQDLRLDTAALLSFGIFCQQGKEVCASSVSKVSKFVFLLSAR
jgi:hypothetical protein